MKTLLCVAEKPSVARTTAGILSQGKFQVENTQDQYVKNYLFQTDFQGQNVDVIFTSVKGHVFELAFPENKKSWTMVDPSTLFSCEVINTVPPANRDLVNNLKRLSRKSHYLMLWLDNDREGENISEEVEEICKQEKPNLIVHRARFSALSPHDVWQAFNHPSQINRADSLAVKLRQETDLRTGSAFTRFQTLHLRQFLKDVSRSAVDTDKKIISYGTCQFPTLGFIVDAYLKHNSFTPEKFWYISVILMKNGQSCELKWERVHLFCKLSVLALYASVLDNPEAKVLNVQTKETHKEKPIPLATVEFQRRVSKYLKIDPHTAMNIAEKIYANGYISYPRTETDSFPSNFNFKEIVDTLGNCQDQTISNYAQNLQWVQPRKGKHSDNAHPPIYPLKPPEGLAGDELKIYNFIARHYLACVSKDAVGDETNVSFDVGGEFFRLSGLRIRERNFLDIYPYTPWNGTLIPPFTIGEEIRPTSIKMHEGQTTAPPLLTEPELIRLMDQKGIGTDATIAEHIQKIISREYTEKINETFYPTKLGLALVKGYQDMGFDFDKPKLRADLEKTMQEIARNPDIFNNEKKRIIREYRDAFSKVSDMKDILDRSFYIQIRSPDPIPDGPREANTVARGRSRGGARGGRNTTRGTGNRRGRTTNR